MMTDNPFYTLHSTLYTLHSTLYTLQGFVDSENRSGNIVHDDWRTILQGENGGLIQLPRMARNKCTYDGAHVRDQYRLYFNSAEGQVPWQLTHVTSLRPLMPEPEG